MKWFTHFTLCNVFRINNFLIIAGLLTGMESRSSSRYEKIEFLGEGQVKMKYGHFPELQPLKANTPI